MIHPFLDSCNLASTFAETAALLADGYYTQKALENPDFGFREGDPLARPFVAHGWGGQIIGGAIVVGADLSLRYVLHRTNHHRIERYVPLGLIGYGTFNALHNAALLRQVERRYRF